MEYVWLKYTWETETEVRAITPDYSWSFKNYIRPIEEWRLKEFDFMPVNKWDIFLCKKEYQDSYKRREIFEINEEWIDDIESIKIWYWTTKSSWICNLDTEEYYLKRTNFWKKWDSLLLYIQKEKDFNLFGEGWKTISINFNYIFDWILSYHQEYLPEYKCEEIDFSDVLKLLENHWYILHYPRIILDKVISNKIVILDKFYDLLDIKHAEIDYYREKEYKIDFISKQNLENTIKNKKENFLVKVDNREQTIYIWNRDFKNFEDFFDLLRIKENDSKMKSQKKWGILLIYAISRYIEDNTKDINNQTILISGLIWYITEFKERWNNWIFEKQSTKISFSKTDCDTVASIFWRCGVKLRFKTKGKEEILITK